MTESANSPGGGNLKYILGGIVLLGGAAALFLALRSPAAPPPQPEPPPPPANVERVNPMAQPDLILDEQKDAGQPQQEAQAEKPKTVVREQRDEWDCSGDLARSALQSVIDSNRAQVRNCYERRLKVNNVLQGDLKLKIKVGTNGQIAAASVAGSLKDNEVFGCVRALAQNWKFPPPTGGCAVVQVPFQFAPKAN